MFPRALAILDRDAIGLAVVPLKSSSWPLVWIGSGLILLLCLIVISLRYPAVVRPIAIWVWDHKLAAFFGLLVVAAAAFGATKIYENFASRPTTAPSDFQVSGDWPLDRGGLRRLGAAENDGNLLLGEKLWTYDRRGEAFYSSPAVAGKYVFAIGSQDDRGRIFCFEQMSGEVVFSCAPPEYRATFSSPVIVDQFLYCGEGLHDARQGRVVCFDLRPGRAGKLVWSFRTNAHVECSPVVVGSRVYIGAGDDGIYCLDGAIVERGSPKIVFHLSGKKYPDAETSLAVHGGRVYAGLGLGGNALCVLDAQTGAEIKRLALPYPVFGLPSIDGGKLYVGLGEGDYVTPDKTPAGQVCCVDLSTLSIDWTYEIPGTVLGAVAVLGRRLYFCGSNGSVYCLTTEGELAARFDSASAILASPAIFGDSVFMVNQSGALYCLDRETLAPRGELSLGTGGRFISSPVVAGERIFLGTETTGFVCVGLQATRRD